MNESASKQRCPECGLELPTGTGSAGCPGCSLRLALPPEAVNSSAASPVPSPPGLQSRYFGDYEILGEIARGGMGVVYRARQLGLNRLVALKMVQSHHLLSDEARLRFRVEIEAVAQLHHPHIVSLYESGEHDGAHYFTMRLVEGGTLADGIAGEERGRGEKEKRSRGEAEGGASSTDSPFPPFSFSPLPRSFVVLLVKVARAVHYAHQRGILHRDLKPSNILVDQQGEPHVADFGLAKSIDQDSGFTFTSSVLGSPNYMAPEQAAGKTRQLTTAVDVYGLGAILYHLLAGRPPFQAKTPIETLRQVVDRDPAAPRSINPGADRDLETIALKCLRKEPAARYATAEDLAQDLERWLAGDPIEACPLGPFQIAWRWSRRHPAAAVLSLALLLALAALAVGTVLAAVRIQRAEQEASKHLRESLLREASSLRLGSELGHRNEGLRLIREAVALGGPPEFRRRARNELLATMARVEPEFRPVSTTNVGARPELNAAHPAFLMFASVEDATNVVFREVEDGAFRSRLRCPDGSITRIERFSRDGRFLALRHGNVLSVWDVKTGQRCFSRAGTNLAMAFHPREDAVLLQPMPYEAVWLELPSGNERLRWKASESRLKGSRFGWHTLALSPDGRRLAGLAGNTLLVELLDAMTGEQLCVITNRAAPISMSWNPDDNSLVVATDDGRVTFWNPTTAGLQWSSPPMIAPAHSLAFHPHRDWLAAGCRDGKVRFIDTHQQRFVFEFPAESWRLAFSPHGTRLGPIWSEGQLGWLETRRAEAFISFGVGRSWAELRGAAFSADGKVLTVGNSERVVICDPYFGRRVTVRNDWHMAACAFHPQEDTLIASEATGISRYTYTYRGADLRLRLSPPEMIHPGAQWRVFAFAPDGGRFAAFNGQSNMVFVFDQRLTNRLSAFGTQGGVDALALSPDGRWLTTGTRTNRAVRLWDVSDGKLILSVPTGDQPRSAFSPDGRWLAATGERFSLLHVGTWKAAPPLPFNEKRPILGAAAFSPDGPMLALVVNRFEVHLFDLRTFESLGILRPPGAIQMLSLVYSPDGAQLAAFGAEARVAVWNMREVQQSLAEFGLAWELSKTNPP